MALILTNPAGSSLSTESVTESVVWAGGQLAQTKNVVFTFTKDVKGIKSITTEDYQGIVDITISNTTVTLKLVLATNSAVTVSTTLEAIV